MFTFIVQQLEKEKDCKNIEDSSSTLITELLEN